MSITNMSFFFFLIHCLWQRVFWTLCTLHFFCRSSVLCTFSLLTFQFKSVYWTSCECFLGTVNARTVSYEHVLMNVCIETSSWFFCSSCLAKHSEVVFVTVGLVSGLFVYRIIDTHYSVLYGKWIVSDGYRPDTSETKIELNYIQGHRKRWTGFETAITVRVSTDGKLKPSNKKL